MLTTSHPKGVKMLTETHPQGVEPTVIQTPPGGANPPPMQYGIPPDGAPVQQSGQANGGSDASTRGAGGGTIPSGMGSNGGSGASTRGAGSGTISHGVGNNGGDGPGTRGTGGSAITRGVGSIHGWNGTVTPTLRRPRPVPPGAEPVRTTATTTRTSVPVRTTATTTKTSDYDDSAVAAAEKPTSPS